MPMFPIMILSLGAALVLGMIVFAFAGPSAERAGTRRLGALRERHSTSAGAAVEAQMRRITANRATRLDLAAGRFLPNVEQLQKRLAMTGKSWTVGQYGMATLGIAVIGGLLLMLKGAPPLLALFVGLFLGAAIPHMVVKFFIKRRLKLFTAKFPDAIELLVRGLRSGLPISETMSVVAAEVPGPVGEEFRNVSDKMKIGRSMDAALQDTADRLGTPESETSMSGDRARSHLAAGCVATLISA